MDSTVLVANEMSALLAGSKSSIKTFLCLFIHKNFCVNQWRCYYETNVMNVASERNVMSIDKGHDIVILAFHQ